MEDNRSCDHCNIDVHRASLGKLLRRKKHLENKRQVDIVIPERLFKGEQTPIEKN